MCIRWDDFVTKASHSSVTDMDNMFNSTIFRLRRLSLLGHVARLDCNSRVEGTGPRVNGFLLNPGHWGCSRRTWVDLVKEDPAAPLASLMCLAANRQAWRSLRYGPLSSSRS